MDMQIVNPSNGRSGGVILFWKREINIQQIFSAPNYIDVCVTESLDKVWRLTGIYGEPRWEDKYKTWDKLRELNGQHNLPWVVLGDFNEILFSHEKEGGNPRPHGYMQAFRDALSDCELEDLGYLGDPFTWRRGRIRERLDRVVANNAWSDLYPGAVVQHLEYIKSDHRPIVLDTEYNAMPQPQRSSARRFEAKWLKENNFREVVGEAWENAKSEVAGGGVLAKLEHLHGALHAWDNRFLQKPKRRLRNAQRILEKALNGPMNDENDTIAKEMADLVELLLEQEEVYWSQRSRANWLMQGDRNTAFFHQFASARRKKNQIKRLKNDNDEWVEGTEALKPLIFQYFSNLFLSEVQETEPELLEKIQPKVTSAMNDKLLAPFTAEDVKKAAFSIGDFKAPGPDGLHAIFYKKFWDMCGADITSEILEAMHTGIIPEGWNDTTVVSHP
jgi:hypothetical protein